MIGAGAASGGVMDASNLIKPVLASGELRCIGSTTYQEYRGIFEKDHALARRFQKIDVVEPSVAETIEILRGLKTRFEEHHGSPTRTTPWSPRPSSRSATSTTATCRTRQSTLSTRRARRCGSSPQAEREPHGRPSRISRQSSRASRASRRRTSRHRIARCCANLERNLKLVIFGQDAAIDALGAAIKMSRAGLGDERQPVGCFLFAGPTGVGKTEVTRQLAIALGVEFLRFDMSEYMERHTVSRLIGAPPGYVGFDQGGLLTEAIAKQPHCVLLLDEIEKAHPDVFNLLLQVMDHGTLTDNNGRKADFRHVIIVMTTNAGAAEMSRASIGFTQSGSRDRRHGGRRAASSRRSSATASTRSSSSQPLDGTTIERVVDKL